MSNYPWGAQYDPNAPWNQKDENFQIDDWYIDGGRNLCITASLSGETETVTIKQLDWEMEVGLQNELDHWYLIHMDEDKNIPVIFWDEAYTLQLLVWNTNYKRRELIYADLTELIAPKLEDKFY